MATKNLMTGPQFKKALERIGVSQRQFAKLNGVNERTVRRWVEDGPPLLVANYVDSLLVRNAVLTGGTHNILG